MRQLRTPAVAAFLVLCFGAEAEAQPRQQPAYCAVPAGARPALPAVFMEGMGSAAFPITTSSEEAQRFFNQGLAQLYSFWFREAERSFMQ